MTSMEIRYNVQVHQNHVGLDVFELGMVRPPKADISIFLTGNIATINAFHSYERKGGYGNGALYGGLLWLLKNGLNVITGGIMRDKNYLYNVDWYINRGFTVDGDGKLSGDVSRAFSRCDDIRRVWKDTIKV